MLRIWNIHNGNEQKMIRKRLTYCIGVFLFLLLASCSSNDRGAGTDAATYIPDAPDYADATMWYTRENSTADKGADIFYLVSTWETDWTTEDGRVCHYADVHNAIAPQRILDHRAAVIEYG